ncbi:MAG: hypothetical protein ACRDZU_01215 [Acidimicrobiales bacterium]
MTMVRRMAAQGLLALLVVTTAAACGGGDDGGTDVATLGNGDGTDDSTDDGDAASSGEELTDAEREDAMLEFTECMRDHGVDMPDPEVAEGPGGGGAIAVTNEASGPGDMEAFEAANEACGDILSDVFGDAPQMDPEQEAEMRDNMLAFAECMRDHGIDMPDPEFESGGGAFSVRVGEPGAGGVDPSDPDFEEAQEACQDLMGFEEGEGPGGGGFSVSSRSAGEKS